MEQNKYILTDEYIMKIAKNHIIDFAHDIEKSIIEKSRKENKYILNSNNIIAIAENYRESFGKIQLTTIEDFSHDIENAILNKINEIVNNALSKEYNND